MGKKFLIIRFSSIGDIIQCMSIIGGIKKKFPDAEIHWITRKDMGSFLAMDPRIDHIWAFDKQKGLKGLWRMAGKLRQEHFDYIYDAHSNIRSNILRLRLRPLGLHRSCFALRSKNRWKRFLLFHFGINRFPWPFRGMVSYRQPLAKWGIRDFNQPAPNWQFPTDYVAKLDHYLQPTTITLVPSANWPKKRWPVTHWQELIRQLPNHHFLILAGPQDYFCEEIKNTAPERVTNLAGRTSLLESCYLIYRSNMVISADTGFLHAADLFGKRTLALMGPTAFGFPTGSHCDILEVELPCRPCSKDGSGKCSQPVFQRCMVDLTVKTVADKIKDYFK